MQVIKYIKIPLLMVLFSALVACGGAEERKEKYLNNGKVYLQQNNLDKARLEFKNVLQIDPKYSQGYYYLGQVDEKLKNFRKALGNYNKAIELKEDNVDAMVGAARVYLIAGAPDKVLALSKKALAISENNIDVIAVRAGALYQTGKKDQAISDLQSNLRINPDHLPSLTLLSRFYQATHQIEKTLPLLTASLEKNPHNINLIVLLVQLYSDEKLYERAAEQIQKLVKLKPDELSYRLRLAYLWDKLGDSKQALFVLQKAVGDLHENREAKRNLIQYSAEKISIESAQQTLAEFIKSDEDPELKLILARLYIKSEKTEKAQEIYAEIIRIYDGEGVAVTAQYQLVRLFLSQQRNEEAEKILAILLKNNPAHHDALILRGTMALAKKSATEKDAMSAILDFRSVQKDLPESTQLMALLADAYLLGGQVDLAQEQLKHLLLLEPKNVKARMIMAKMYFQEKQFANSLEQLVVFLKIYPGNPQAQGLQFKAYLSLQDYAQATQLAQQIKKQQPQSMLGWFYHGLVLQAQHKLSASLKQFEKALQVNPHAIEPLGAYVSVALTMKKPELAERKLKAILVDDNKNLIAQNLLGEVLLKRQQNSAAAEAFVKAIALAVEADGAWWLPYRNLAVAQLNMQQPQKALKTARQGYELTQSERLLVLYANQLQRQNNVDEAIAVYEAHLLSQPHSSLAANNLAVLLVEYRDDKPSKSRAISLVKPFNDTQNASYLDTLGWVHYKRGEFDQAISVLLKANEISPQQTLIYYHLGKAYLDKGDKSSAQKYLQKVANSSVTLKNREDAQRILLMLDKA